MKKSRKQKIFYITSFLFLLIIVGTYFYKDGLLYDSIGIHVEPPFKKTMEVPAKHTKVDSNLNGISDAIDIVNTARMEAKNKIPYESNYYEGGYPPASEGVCTDVVWRALKEINIDLKTLIDNDILENTKQYKRVAGKPDPNIDFRRVPNQHVYFENHLESLTTKIIPYDVSNLEQWQAGDIVLFLGSFDHVGIVSDKRAKDGTPYFIHNTPPFASEIKLTSLSNYTPITGHYRWNYKNNQIEKEISH